MAQYYDGTNQYGGGAASAQNLQFYPSTYSQGAPTQGYGYAAPGPSSYEGFGGAAGGVNGRMGEQGGLQKGWLAAFSTDGYPGEPPLLEELGINLGHVQMKTLAVLNPVAQVDRHIMDDSDLAGPILFFLVFGISLLLSGKVHFGYIYGLAVMGTIALHTILSLMAPDESDPSSSSHDSAPYGAAPGYPAADGGAGGVDKGHLSSTLTFAKSASVLGYCLLPLVLISLVGIAMPMDGPIGYLLTSLTILWCTISASGIFCKVGRMKEMRLLVAYPLMLFYAGFGIMSIFSSRGTGRLAEATSMP
ncbi:hypothetical protein GGR56DRAFT_637343 [Xylariaceae sp. FL0804]|nr:hypothetical protein GGR56DRAFT_637343 [Xylariaceae sp. FL0804]